MRSAEGKSPDFEFFLERKGKEKVGLGNDNVKKGSQSESDSTKRGRNAE